MFPFVNYGTYIKAYCPVGTGTYTKSTAGSGADSQLPVFKRNTGMAIGAYTGTGRSITGKRKRTKVNLAAGLSLRTGKGFTAYRSTNRPVITLTNCCLAVSFRTGKAFSMAGSANSAEGKVFSKVDTAIGRNRCSGRN